MFFQKRRVPFLIVGHPRCGTTSAAEICRRAGLDVGDEWVGKDGISSWMMAVDDNWNPYSLDRAGRSRKRIRWDHLILVVRDIQSAVPSVMVENAHAAPSYQFRQRWIKKLLGNDLFDSRDAMTAAIQSIVLWARIILDQDPILSFRIEDQQDLLRNFVKSAAKMSDSACATEEVKVNASKLYDGIRHEKPNIGSEDWARLAPDVKRQVAWYCERFGYSSPVDPYPYTIAR